MMASYMACLTLDYIKYFCLNYNRLRKVKLTATEKVKTLKAMVIIKMVSFLFAKLPLWPGMITTHSQLKLDKLRW